MPDNNSNFVALCGDGEWDSEDSRNFIETLCSSLRKRFGEDYQIKYMERPGFNGTRIRGILIKYNALGTGKFIHLGHCEEWYRSGHDIEDCAGIIMEKYDRTVHFSEVKAEAEKLDIWENVKDRVLPFLISYEWNEEYLEPMVYEKKLDLAIGCYIKVEKLSGNVYIKKEMLETWGISKEELMKQVLYNLEKEDCSITGLEEMIKEMTGIQWEDEDPVQMMVMTNHDKYMGAAGILNEELLKKCSDQINNSMYILPSSIHEMMFVPCQPDIDPQELQKIVYEINRECVAEEERLSDHVYLYDRDTADISIAA